MDIKPGETPEIIDRSSASMRPQDGGCSYKSPRDSVSTMYLGLVFVSTPSGKAVSLGVGLQLLNCRQPRQKFRGCDPMRPGPSNGTGRAIVLFRCK